MIVIDANIGAGKTTLLRLLKQCESIGGMPIIEENVDEWGPYLSEFYKDMHKNALLFQMKVLEHHLSVRPPANYLQLHERSPLSCIEVFGQCLLEDGHLGPMDMELMRSFNRRLGWIPKYVIYVQTPPEICKLRIQRRHRNGEDGIQLSYLQRLYAHYETLYQSNGSDYPWTVFTVDGTQCEMEVFKQTVRILQTIRRMETGLPPSVSLR